MNKTLHQCAILLAVWTLLLVVAGGLVATNDAGLSVLDWPLSYGKLTPEGMLMVAMVIWLWMRIERRHLSGRAGLPPAMALFTSREWLEGDREMVEKPHAPIRALAVVVPLGVLGQLALGAAARDQALGTIWHICGSSIVTGLVLWFVVRILLHYADHPALRKSAIALLVITFVQVFLGLAAYLSRLATIDAPQPMPIMILFTVLHVATGALTMEASVVGAIEVYRNVRPEHRFAQGVAVTS